MVYYLYTLGGIFMNEAVTRRERKKNIILNTLLDNAMDLFINKGFEKTTITDITKKADVGTGTFYNYFNSKEDLLQYILSAKLNQAEAELKKIQLADNLPQDKLLQILLLMGNIYENNRGLFKLCIDNLKMQEPPHGEHFKNILTEIINSGKNKGIIKKDIPAAIIIEMFMGLLKSALVSRIDISFPENIKYKLDLFLYGIINE